MNARAQGDVDAAAVREYFIGLQRRIVAALEAEDGRPFRLDSWTREEGGGGASCVLEEGNLLERGGVNFSHVLGDRLPPSASAGRPELAGRGFEATGVSLVLHPRSPMVPTTHANFRFLEKGDRSWFGGGADLTPYYLVREDAAHFHRTLAAACGEQYPRFKKWCDEYFYLEHRGETRGVGGVFFDYIEDGFDLAMSCGAAFVPAYAPIVERRRDDAWGEAERRWQLQRRGRYVEFNLVFDRGTTFGLKTGGRIESILMSLPPLVRWDYDVQPPGPREAELLEVLKKPVDWL